MNGLATLTWSNALSVTSRDKDEAIQQPDVLWTQAQSERKAETGAARHQDGNRVSKTM